MMYPSLDGRRVYVTNTLLWTLDHASRPYVRLIHIGPNGMSVDPFFNVDLNHFPTGPSLYKDILIYLLLSVWRCEPSPETTETGRGIRRATARRR
jgi:hypothetical protein